MNMFIVIVLIAAAVTIFACWLILTRKMLHGLTNYKKSHLALLVLSLIALWTFVGLLPMVFYDAPDEPHEFGDTFGFANSLLGAVNMILIAVALLLQTQELAHQREELQRSQQVSREQTNSLYVTTYLAVLSSVVDAESGSESGEDLRRVLASLKPTFGRVIEDILVRESEIASEEKRRRLRAKVYGNLVFLGRLMSNRGREDNDKLDLVQTELSDCALKLSVAANELLDNAKNDLEIEQGNELARLSELSGKISVKTAIAPQSIWDEVFILAAECERLAKKFELS
jgi:uncharacterized membrane protein